MTTRCITQSEMVTFGRCEQLHQFKYLQRLRPHLESSSLEMGTAVHLGLELQDPAAAFKFIQDKKARLITRDSLESADVASGIARIMVAGALRQWDDWPEIQEFEFVLPLRNPKTGRVSRAHAFAGKMDGLCLKNNEVTEYKTSSRVDNSYMDRLDVDFQVSAMLEAASLEFKKPFRRMRYKIIRKPTMKRRKGDTVDDYLNRMAVDYAKRPEFYYFEETVTRSEQQMDLWRREAWEIHKRIMYTENGGQAVRNTESCVGRFGRCAFLDLCCGAVTKDAYRVIDDPHPELGAA